jgi:hypothetical protein
MEEELNLFLSVFAHIYYSENNLIIILNVIVLKIEVSIKLKDLSLKLSAISEIEVRFS